MAKQTKTAVTQLPEADHPFARWGAGAGISLWAVAAQSLPDPWNKIAAILSPGFGYGVGLVLDAVARRISERNLRLRDGKFLAENKKLIDALYAEKEDALRLGANEDIIEAIEVSIQYHQKERYSKFTPVGKISNRVVRTTLDKK